MVAGSLKATQSLSTDHIPEKDKTNSAIKRFQYDRQSTRQFQYNATAIKLLKPNNRDFTKACVKRINSHVYDLVNF